MHFFVFFLGSILKFKISKHKTESRILKWIKKQVKIDLLYICLLFLWSIDDFPTMIFFVLPLIKFFVGLHWKWLWVLSKDSTKTYFQTNESNFADSELDSGYHICNIVWMLHDCNFFPDFCPKCA